MTVRPPRRVVVLVPLDRPLSITCHACGRKSHHPTDVRECYCGACNKYHTELGDFTIEIPSPRYQRDTDGVT
jgi:hypothetical protein